MSVFENTLLLVNVAYVSEYTQGTALTQLTGTRK